jgi:frataxin
MKLLRLIPRARAAASSHRALTTLTRQPLRTQPTPQVQPIRNRPSFSTTAHTRKGLQPDSADPAPPKTEPHVSSSTQEPAQLTDEQFHEKAEDYLERLVLALEEMVEEATDLEVEYSVRSPSTPSHSTSSHPLPSPHQTQTNTPRPA